MDTSTWSVTPQRKGKVSGPQKKERRSCRACALAQPHLHEDRAPEGIVRPEYGPPPVDAADAGAAAAVASWTAMWSRSRSPGSLSEFVAASRQAFGVERAGVPGALEMPRGAGLRYGEVRWYGGDPDLRERRGGIKVETWLNEARQPVVPEQFTRARKENWYCRYHGGSGTCNLAWLKTATTLTNSCTRFRCRGNSTDWVSAKTMAFRAIFLPASRFQGRILPFFAGLCPHYISPRKTTEGNTYIQRIHGYRETCRRGRFKIEVQEEEKEEETNGEREEIQCFAAWLPSPVFFVVQTRLQPGDLLPKPGLVSLVFK